MTVLMLDIISLERRSLDWIVRQLSRTIQVFDANHVEVLQGQMAIADLV